MKKITCTLFLAFACSLLTSYGQTATHIVIGQVYGGGGNSGAPYLNDYIELFNPTNLPVDLTGWSVQYASATGSNWSMTPLTGIIAPNSYFLIQESSGGANGIPLPTPDAMDNTAMAATAGKIVLCNAATAFVGTCPTSSSIVDLVGYGATANCFEGSGPAPAPGNATAVFRADTGCTDADVNATDFAAAAPAPRNSTSPTHLCSPTGILHSVNENSVFIYPNPVRDKLFVTGYMLYDITDIKIRDVFGNLIRSRQSSASSKQQLIIDVTSLSNGIYFLKIFDGKKIFSAKFIKE